MTKAWIAALAIALTGGAATMTSAETDEGFAIDLRGWILLDDDETYDLDVIDRAAAAGAEHVQLSHHLVMRTAEAVDDPERAALLNRLIDRAHERGLRAYVWTHELDELPEALRPGDGGKVDMDDPALADAVRDRYRALFRVLPAVDGVVLTLSETAFRVFDDNQVQTRMSKAERVTWIVEQVRAACREDDRERTLIVRDWGNLGGGDWDNLQEIRAGIAAVPADVMVMTKITAGDWYMMVRSPLIGRYPGRVQIAEFDLCGEHHGHQNVPWCAPGYIRSEFRWALDQGVKGAVGRVDRMESHVFGRPGEINIEAFTRLWRDPSTTEHRIWTDWAAARYGKDAAPWVIAAFKPTHDIILTTHYVKGCYFLQNHSSIPTLDYVHDHLAHFRASQWDPSYEWIEGKLLEPDRSVLEMVLEEKDEAVAMTEQAFGNLERAREYLDPEQYEALNAELVRLRHVVEIFRRLSAAYFLWRIDAPADELAPAVTAVDSIADETAERYGDDFLLGRPSKPRAWAVRGLRSFAAEIRDRRPDLVETADPSATD